MDYIANEFVEKRTELFDILESNDERLSISTVVKKLAALENMAENKGKELSEKAGKAEKQVETNIDEINVLYAEMKKAEGSRCQIEVALANLVEKVKQLNITEKNLATQIENSERCLRNAQKAKHEAEIKATRYCWVPGYNIYLLVDYVGECEKLSGRLKSERQMREEINRQLCRLNDEKMKIEREIFKNRESVSELAGKIKQLENNQKMLLDIQQKLRMEMIEWQNQSLYYRCLKEKISCYKSYVEIEEEVKEEIAKFIEEAPLVIGEAA